MSEENFFHTGGQLSYRRYGLWYGFLAREKSRIAVLIGWRFSRKNIVYHQTRFQRFAGYEALKEKDKKNLWTRTPFWTTGKNSKVGETIRQLMYNLHT